MNTLIGWTLCTVAIWVLIGLKDVVIFYMTDKTKGNKYLIKHILIPASFSLFTMALGIYSICFQ